MTRRWLFLSVAVLTLVSQVAVSTHIPALDDEPVSKCHEGARHFCAEALPEHSGPCALCQASVGSPELVLAGDVQEFPIAEPLVLADESGPRSLFKFSAAAPRAPPVG